MNDKTNNETTEREDPGAPTRYVCGVPVYSPEAQAWNAAEAARIEAQRRATEGKS